MKYIRLLALIFLLLAGGTAQAATKDKTVPQEAVRTEVKHQVPVTLDGETLFFIRDRVLSFSPAVRARLISEKLDRLAKDPLTRSDTITTIDEEAATDIVAGDTVIMSVTDRDAAPEGKSRQEVAKDYAERIRGAIEKHNREYSMNSILRGAIYTFLATAVLIALLFVFRRTFPGIYAKIDSWRGTRIRSIKIQSFEIIHADRIAAIIRELARGARVLLTLSLFYFYIPLVFSFFPWTRGFSARLFGYTTSPFLKLGSTILVYLPNLFFIAVIILVTHFVIKFTALFFNEIAKGTITFPGFYADWAEPTFKIVRFLIIAFAAIVAFPYFPGSDSPVFKGVSIFFGVLFSLGSTSAVANIIAGIILIYTRAFKIGDRVKIGDTIGDVAEKTLLVTRVRTIKNVDITIPNASLLGNHISNFSNTAREHGLILHTSVTIGYDAPWRKVHELLIAAAAATEDILKTPAPFVHQTSLDDFYVTYELNAYTDQPRRMAMIYSDLHQNIQDRFNEAGVEIMSPHYTQIRDGNTVTIPGEYRPGDYKPGALRIFQSGNLAGDVRTDSSSERKL